MFQEIIMEGLSSTLRSYFASTLPLATVSVIRTYVIDAISQQDTDSKRSIPNTFSVEST